MLTVREVPRRGALICALLATAEIMLGTVAAHTWAGGALPSAAWLVAIGGLVLAASLAVQRARVSLGVAVPALAAAQLLLHCWLMTLAPSGPAAAHAMHHGSDGGALQLTAPMLLAHLAAAVLTALVWGARRRAVEILLTWGRVVRVPVPTVRPLASLRLPSYARIEALLRHAPTRGPPLVLARA